jgi:hypothetical protein
MGQSPLMNKVLGCKPNLFFLHFIMLLVCLDCKLSFSKYLESFSRTWQKWLTKMSGKLQCHYEVKSHCWLLNFPTVAGNGCCSGWVRWGWCWLLRGQHPSYFLVRRRSFFCPYEQLFITFVGASLSHGHLRGLPVENQPNVELWVGDNFKYYGKKLGER